jgi:hypothetical protein
MTYRYIILTDDFRILTSLKNKEVAINVLKEFKMLYLHSFMFIYDAIDKLCIDIKT